MGQKTGLALAPDEDPCYAESEGVCKGCWPAWKSPVSISFWI